MLICGRVLACPHPGEALVDDGFENHLVRVGGVDLVPGDLVRIAAEPANTLDAPHIATHVERVFRPVRPPFALGTETRALLSSGRIDRLVDRARIATAVREHFANEGSLEVDTPSIATSPGLDVHLHAFEITRPTRAPYDPDQSGRRESIPALGLPYGYLITSPEYHMKRLLVGGLRRCHQFARCFRVDEGGTRHEPEFTMLEWYRAWDDMDAMLTDTMAVARVAFDAVSDVRGETDRVEVRGRPVRLDDGFERVTVRDAFARWAADAGDPIELAERDEDEYFGVLVDRIEPHLGRERPMFLTQFPAKHASLARLSPEDPRVCDRFELYIGGMELSNGFVELTDPIEQRERLERDQRDRAARGLPVYPIDERFLAALEEGMPPAVGNALGFDRLVAIALGCDSIAEVIAFPAVRR